MPKSKIAEKSEYNLSFETYRPVTLVNSNYEMVELGEVCELKRGIVYNKNDEVEENGLKVLRANNIDKNSSCLYLSDIKEINSNVKLSNDKILKKNDIFICLASWSKEHIWKVAFIYQDTEFYFWWFMWAIRIKKSDISAKYLFYQLANLRFNKFINSQIAWTNINNLSWKILYNFKIPLPPLEIQEQIVWEIEKYQKEIENKKQEIIDLEKKIKDKIWEVWGENISL